ncbi:MAG: S9 family peptidase [Acidobacteria bacterium]|nr:S9 family peptidase [Acidobacteriota bacterium]MDW7984181.1 S9 family peptidase [Acidobacteriota bacterium]
MVRTSRPWTRLAWVGLTAVAALAAGPRSARYDIERYLAIPTVSSPTWSPDGRWLAFLTNVTGVPQVWRIPSTGGCPEPLSFFSERAAFVEWSPRPDRLVFGMDVGGNERWQIYSLSSDGAVAERLTTQDRVIHDFGDWGPDGGWFLYASNERDARYFDVYRYDWTARTAQRVFQGDATHSVVRVAPDGRSALLVRRNTNLDEDLLLLDLATYDVTHLTPHSGEARYTPAAWLPDGRGFYLVTDEGREQAGVALYDLTQRAFRYVETPPHEVTTLDVSPDGRYLAWVENHDGWSILRVKDLRQDRLVQPPDLPAGVISSLRFDPQGNRLAFVLSRPTAPADIWTLDVNNRRWTQVTRTHTAGIPSETFVAPRLVRYPAPDGLSIPAWLYLPPQSTPPHRVVMSIHGGPEAQELPRFQPVYQYLLHRGLAVFAPNIRGSTGYGRTYVHLDDVEKRGAAIADVAAGARWLVAQGYTTYDRIAIMGASYGGYMTMAAITFYPDLWGAAVNIVGIVNFETFLKNTGPWRRHLREAEYGSLDRHLDVLRRFSPIHRVDQIRVPLLIIHGENDPRVPVGEARQVYEALRTRNHPVELLIFPDEGHGITKLNNRIAAYRRIVEFLERTLGPGR